MTGLVAGTSVYALLLAVGYPEVWNIHAGIVGLAVNIGVCIVVSRVVTPESLTV